MIPDGCLSVGNNAFANCKNLHEIQIPSSVISIGPNAFGNSEHVILYGTSGSFAENGRMITDIHSFQDNYGLIKR